MTFFDLFFVNFLLLFLAIGLAGGIMQSIGSLLGVYFGVILADRLFEELSNFFTSILIPDENLAKVLSFSIILIFITRLFGFIFYTVDRSFRIAKKFPFLNTVNTLGGGILGILEGIFVLGFIVVVYHQFPLDTRISSALYHSSVATFFVEAAKYVSPIIIGGWDKLKSLNIL